MYDLSNAGPIISSEASSDLVGCWSNIAQAHPIRILRFSPHPRNGQDLLVFCHALLQLPKEDSQTCDKLLALVWKAPRRSPHPLHSPQTRKNLQSLA
jgi:hypothetical protein